MVNLRIEERDWPAVIDTGFNGDLELPEELRALLQVEYGGRVRSLLAAGVEVEEELYVVRFPFDNSERTALASFVSKPEILIGTGLMESHRLDINFPARTVVLQAAAAAGS